MPVLGQQLAEAREAQGLSVEDVSNRLRLSPRQIKALEEDDFTQLPEAMITRGFIRNYARLLELDPEPLLEAYRAHVPSEPPRAISIPSANIPISDSNRRPWLLYLFGGVLIAVVLGVWLYAEERPLAPTQTTAPVPMSEAPVNVSPSSSVETLPEPALPIGERVGEELPVTTEDAAPAAAQPLASEPEAQVDTNTANTAAAPAGQARLELSFNDTSWVSVIDGNNQEILNKTKPAGSQEVLEGKPPFKVVVGNAAASKVVFNGKPVDLTPHTRLNVARITLE
jgi:cytoskeleton protein RodZ